MLIGSQHKLDPEIPSPLQFDHVITRVPVDGQEIWLDSTNGVAPFRMLAFPLRDKEALAMPPGGTPGLVRTPANLPFDSFDRSQIEGSLNDTGKLTVHFDAAARGDAELGLRFGLRQIPNNRWKNAFEMMIAELADEGWRDHELQGRRPHGDRQADGDGFRCRGQQLFRLVSCRSQAAAADYRRSDTA